MQLELRHLRIVLAVAQAGSISRAAAAVQLTQPGVTSQLRRIEKEFGGALFLRARDGVVPTELGQYVVLQTRWLLDGFDELVATSRILGRSASPVVPMHIGGVPGQLLPLLLTVVKRAFPNRTVAGRSELMTATLLESLRVGELDLALLHEFPSFPARFPVKVPSGVEQRTLLTEPVFVGLPAGHPLASWPDVQLADLASEEWVLPREDDTGLRASFRLACEAVGFTPHVRHVSDEYDTVGELVRTSQATCLLYPTASVAPGVVAVPLADNPIHRRIALAWPSASPIADRVADVRDGAIAGYRRFAEASPVYAAWLDRHGDTTLLAS